MIPELDLLLGAEVHHVLAAAVGGYRGRLEQLRVSTVDVAPDGAATAKYAASVLRADGSRTAEVLVAATGGHIPAGAAIIDGVHRDRDVRVGVWRWPQDPLLPALTTLSDPLRLAERFRQFGLSNASSLDIEVRSYQPAHHAVLKATDERHTWFVKVVRPSAITDLTVRHEMASSHTVAPPVLAATTDGAIVLPKLIGTPMICAIRSGGVLPSPRALERLLDSLPRVLLGLARRRSHVERAHDYIEVLRHTSVGESAVLARVDRLAEALLTVDCDDRTLVPVHGDFYEGQLLTRGHRVTGVFDLDSAGPGYRVDDWATLLAHLTGLSFDDQCRATARSFAAEVTDYAAGRSSLATLERHTAAALVGFATGPFRDQHPEWPRYTAACLDLAWEWLTGAVNLV